VQTVLFPRYEKAMRDLLERVRLSPISGGKDFRQVLLERIDKFRIQIPPELPNWGALVEFDEAGKVALDDGIPLAYIPPAAIVTRILAAQSPADRRQVLVDETPAITEACRVIVTDAKITAAFPEYTPLAQAAVRALAEGHYQGAQALAVNVAESFVREWIAEKYHKVKKHVLEADPAKADPNEPWIPSRLRLEMMILPLLKFFDDWSPKSRKSAPTDLSRHLTAHQATAAHYTPINAVVAVMLMTSLLAGFTDAMT
jgi:hypothetical protein